MGGKKNQGCVNVTRDREMATEEVIISTGYHRLLCDPEASKISVLRVLRK